MDEVLFKPEHSLIDQSLHSDMGATTTNGDGFGLAWYGNREKPGIYRDVQPAWNDSNLKNLAEQIESPLFLAHVRATTGTAIQRTNCHPFQHENWVFVHNGIIHGFEKMKRDLMLEIRPEFFSLVQGSTDSEVMFYLALSHGMMDDVAVGLSRMVNIIEQCADKHGVKNPVQMTLGISDGKALYGVRYSSEGQSRSLFHSISMEAMRQIAPDVENFTDDARALVSEPIGHQPDAWVEIPESSFVKIQNGEVVISRFELKNESIAAN